MFIVDRVARSLDSIDEPAPMRIAGEMTRMSMPYMKLPLRNSRELVEIVKGSHLPPQAG